VVSPLHNTVLEEPSSFLQCGTRLPDEDTDGRCTDKEGCNNRKRELLRIGHSDHGPIFIESDTESPPEAEQVISEMEQRVITSSWENFENTCYIEAVTKCLHQLDYFTTWFSDNSVPHLCDLSDATPADFPVNKYVTGLRQNGLQR
jgi:hypothetical protein